MWAIFFVVVAVVIVIIEVPSLLKKKLKKELWVFSILLILGLGFSIAQSLDVDLPNPADWIAFVYKPFSDLIYGFLE
jgi:glucan phosphoethanolaminetransferase (alkaline phosphatase superfamily)